MLTEYGQPCNLCNGPIYHVLYDARLKGQSSWATMCEVCFNENGAGLGTGVGQKYEWDKTQQRYVKVAG